MLTKQIRSLHDVDDVLVTDITVNNTKIMPYTALSNMANLSLPLHKTSFKHNGC